MYHFIKKGTKIRFSFLRPKEMGTYSLAGAQMKLACDEVSGEGIVRNIWADDPEGHKNLRFNVELPDGSFVEVPDKGVTGLA